MRGRFLYRLWIGRKSHPDIDRPVLVVTSTYSSAGFRSDARQGNLREAVNPLSKPAAPRFERRFGHLFLVHPRYIALDCTVALGWDRVQVLWTTGRSLLTR